MVKYHMRLISILLLTLLCITASAEPRVLNKPVTCDDRDRVFTVIRDEFKETPQWWGASPAQGTHVILTVNLTTGAWTMIEFNQTTACVLAVGEKSSSAWGTPI
jgi:hypothetical protein